MKHIGRNRLRRIDGRVAVEFEIDSGFSHLVYLTNEPLDAEEDHVDLVQALADLELCLARNRAWLLRQEADAVLGRVKDARGEEELHQPAPATEHGCRLDSLARAVHPGQHDEMLGHSPLGTLTAPRTVVLEAGHFFKPLEDPSQVGVGAALHTTDPNHPAAERQQP